MTNLKVKYSAITLYLAILFSILFVCVYFIPTAALEYNTRILFISILSIISVLLWSMRFSLIGGFVSSILFIILYYVIYYGLENINDYILIPKYIHNFALLGIGLFSGYIIQLYHKLHEVLDEEKILKLELTQKNVRLELLSSTDYLTGLFNRRYFFIVAETLFSANIRHFHKFCIAMIDIDYFKQINDKHGHDIGDETLIRIARFFKKTIRGSDTIARFGGEEFILLMPDTDIKMATNMIERLRQDLESLIIPAAGLQIKITASFGLSECKRTDKSLDEIIQRADKALYQAKSQGRNRMVVQDGNS